MKRDLRVRLYCLASVNELPDATCCALLDNSQVLHPAKRFFFSDECTTYHSAGDKTVVFWSKKNPRFTHELEYNPLHVITSDYLIGPYCLDGPVNIAAYSAMVQTWLKPRLRYRRLTDDVWLQQDGACVHTHTHTHWTLLCTMF
jgi:hypothetical protein